MAISINIPDSLLNLLKNSEFEGPVRDYTTKTATILGDNKTPFFPFYTDHGPDHIERILDTIIRRLAPEGVLQIFTDSDAAVLICSVLLHDIAMHLNQKGFLDLINERTEHQPIPWFGGADSPQGPERSWKDMWAGFVADVRRFNEQQFSEITGVQPESDNLRHWLVTDLPCDVNAWNQYDRLLIGEFIRRYHGRLAHEIALFGFPGLPSDEFPVLTKTVPQLANLSGLVARSHTMSLRHVLDYLEYTHKSDLRPRGVLVVYHMALIRIADYLQLECQRAPRILFKLRSPHISKTIDEWNKHGAIAHISYLHEDPTAIKIELNGNHSLATHIQMSQLIDDLQRELDTSSAVLSEVYGRTTEDSLHILRLNKVRVYSNHEDRALLTSLPYLPLNARFAADPKILSLMISPMYGEYPEIGVRELMQNAVDSVLERQMFCQKQGISTDEVTFYDQDSDVVIEFTIQEGGTWVLRVVDKGIGMKADTVMNYFLKAGASFRDSTAWRDIFVNREGRSTISRSGRFGIGVFATFLIGHSIEVATRHIEETGGLSFTVTKDSELIELRKTDVPVGTSISVQLSTEAVQWIEKHEKGDSWDWFAYEAPSVTRKIRKGSQVKVLPQAVSLSGEQLSGSVPEWSRFHTDLFGVTWGMGNKGHLFCNCIAIANVEKQRYEEKNILKHSSYEWDNSYLFKPPLLCVTDPEGAMPLHLRRDCLSGPLPFEQELKDEILLDFIAFLLARAPQSALWSGASDLKYTKEYPLLDVPGIAMMWFCSQQGVAPLDRMILSTCKADRMLLCGYVSETTVNAMTWPKVEIDLSANVIALAFGNSLRRSAKENREYSERRKYRDEKEAEPQKENDPDERIRLDLINLVGGMRDSKDIDVIGARFLVSSPKTGAILDFAAGQAFSTDSKLNSLLESGQETFAVLSYNWETGQQQAQRRDSFAAELLIKPRDGVTLFGKRWREVVGDRLIPFDLNERESLLKQIRHIHNMGARIDKWQGA